MLIVALISEVPIREFFLQQMSEIVIAALSAQRNIWAINPLEKDKAIFNILT